MRYKFFFIPALFPETSEQALNQFLSSHAVIAIDREFCDGDDATGWSVCVSWNESPASVEHSAGQLKSKRDAIDYREVLGEDDFAVYAGLRDLRKQIADESGQFVYQIFSNKQLAEMVTRRVKSETAMGEIPGVGKSRLNQYAKPFLELLVQLQSDEA